LARARRHGARLAPDLLDRLAGTLHEASLYRDAISADQLYLARYPTEPRALAVAARVLDSYGQWNQADGLLAARETIGTRFAPGSDWARGQLPDSLKKAGAEFARVALADAAVEHHRRARAAGDGAAGWAHAADLYARLLRLWPDQADAPRLHLYAGEVAEKQAQPAGARALHDRRRRRHRGVGTEALWCRARPPGRRGARSRALDLTPRPRRGPPEARCRLSTRIDARHRAHGRRRRRPVAGARRPAPAAAEAARRSTAPVPTTPRQPSGRRAGRLAPTGRRHPEHELAADALLPSPEAEKRRTRRRAAAPQFAERHPPTKRARRPAQVDDLTEAGGDTTGADQLRAHRVQRFPPTTSALALREAGSP
jgi:hypothetical protein